MGPANAILAMLAPKIKEGGDSPQENQEERVEKLFKLLDLKSLETWPEAEQEKAKKLITEYQDIFALKDTELGHTKLTKHEINSWMTNPSKKDIGGYLLNSLKRLGSTWRDGEHRGHKEKSKFLS